jgi:hypothetical protein
MSRSFSLFIDESSYDAKSITGSTQDYYLNDTADYGSFNVESPFADDINSNKKFVPGLLNAPNPTNVSGVESPLADDSPASFSINANYYPFLVFGLLYLFITSQR